ncbi:NDUF B8 domain containing protein [Asbolus verrucosus]|uniref:NDUF B8 domain containing protein n=1 Tax=Asbolus verrucosus TaxID=1661398 RepID=A0A482W5T0_ASBVE|nr:NDUF B8 domain containing protein [Asbolus verrucosus]
MSSLIKSAKIAQLCLRSNPVLVTAIRHHWNKDYKPGPYPQTEEERKKAAEKYGLHRSEYKPYPDDGTGYGDYPKLPDVAAEMKDPFYPWDNPELKRNFNEPLHADFDLMREDRYNVSPQLRFPMWLQWMQFLGVMFGTFLLYHILENVKMFHAVTPRQYPNDGKKHYTFEQE